MALFESYERRIDQINSVLNNYGISSVEEAEKITKDAGLDVYEQVKKIQRSYRNQKRRKKGGRRSSSYRGRPSGILHPGLRCRPQESRPWPWEPW